MIRRFISFTIDELIGLMLLHEVLRFANRHPRQGDPAMAIFSPDATPDQLFAPQPEPARLITLRAGFRETPSALVHDLAFRSPVSTSFRRNNTVQVRHWQSRQALGDRRPPLVCIVLDGLVQFGLGNARLFASRLNPRGIDVLGMDLPFNHRRTPPGYRPGQLLVGGDVPHILAAMRQAILDTWSLILHFQREGHPVALAGISFGGWTVLMTCVMAEGLHSVTAVAPPVDLLRVLSEGGVILRAARRGIDLGPADLEALKPTARLLNPSCWQPRLSPERITLHAAAYDRFVPTVRVEQLAASWGANLVHHRVGHIELTSVPLWLSRVANGIEETRL